MQDYNGEFWNFDDQCSPQNTSSALFLSLGHLVSLERRYSSDFYNNLNFIGHIFVKSRLLEVRYRDTIKYAHLKWFDVIWFQSEWYTPVIFWGISQDTTNLHES